MNVRDIIGVKETLNNSKFVLSIEIEIGSTHKE